MRPNTNPEENAPRGRGRRGPGREDRRAFGEAIAEALEHGDEGDRDERGSRGRGRRGHHGGPGGGPRGRGFGRPGGWQQGDLPSVDDVEKWFIGRLPANWFTDLTVTTDREEVTVVGTLNEEPMTGAEAEGRISRWRAETRDERIAVAQEAERRYGRKVAWGVRLGDVEELFTHLAVPVMTRLRQPERQVLDTLVDAGVARSRSDALAWSVRLVGQHSQEWLGQLREAMAEVDKLRAQGPTG